jgi:hypothetical protein
MSQENVEIVRSQVRPSKQPGCGSRPDLEVRAVNKAQTLSLFRIIVRGKGSGVELAREDASVADFRDDKIVRIAYSESRRLRGPVPVRRIPRTGRLRPTEVGAGHEHEVVCDLVEPPAEIASSERIKERSHGLHVVQRHRPRSISCEGEISRRKSADLRCVSARTGA